MLQRPVLLSRSLPRRRRLDGRAIEPQLPHCARRRGLGPRRGHFHQLLLHGLVSLDQVLGRLVDHLEDLPRTRELRRDDHRAGTSVGRVPIGLSPALGVGRPPADCLALPHAEPALLWAAEGADT